MWIKFRHRVVIEIIRPFFTLYLKFKYKLTHDKAIKMPEGSVILCNHTTTLDPFMLNLLFKQNVYFMASKDIFNHRFTGGLIRFLVNPIPKEKGNKSDISAIKSCMKVAKENGNIGIFPEGNRTLSGKLGYIDFSIVKLVKALKKPLVICNITGGYPTDPRWGSTIRKGRMHVSFREIYQYEDINAMSNEDLYNLIIEKLTVDDYSYMVDYKGKKIAENLERVLYICPICGHMHTIYTKDNKIYCKDCGLEVTYLPSIRLESNNEKFKFNNVSGWYDWQIEEIKKKSYLKDELIYQEDLELYLSLPFKSKQLVGDGVLKMYNDRFEFDYNEENVVIDFKDISGITLVGKKKMNIYTNDKTYQVFKSSKTNLLKYMHMYYVITNEEENYEFLGL